MEALFLTKAILQNGDWVYASVTETVGFLTGRRCRVRARKNVQEKGVRRMQVMVHMLELTAKKGFSLFRFAFLITVTGNKKGVLHLRSKEQNGLQQTHIEVAGKDYHALKVLIMVVIIFLVRSLMFLSVHVDG